MSPKNPHRMMLFFIYVSFNIFILGPICVNSQKLWQSWSEPKEPSLAEKEVNLTVVNGRSALLLCKVQNLKDKTVSWIREKDLTVLAVDTVTYTADQRFTVKHTEGTSDWGLHIQGVRANDTGSYDCQLNTHPKKSTKVHLRVISRYAVEASFFDMPISDTGLAKQHWPHLIDLESDIPSELPTGTVLVLRGTTPHKLDKEDSLQVTCVAYGKHVIAYLSSSTPHRFIGWTLDDVPVTSLFPEWKVKIQETRNDSTIHSQLTIKTVSHDDSGRLACIAPEATPVSFAFDVKEIKSQIQHYAGLSNSKPKFTDAHRHAHQLKASTAEASGQTTLFTNNMIYISIILHATVIIINIINTR